MKIDENRYHWQRKFLYLLNLLRNFNEIFRKDVTYDNIKSNKPRFKPLLRRYIFEKTTGGRVKLILLSLFLCFVFTIRKTPSNIMNKKLISCLYIFLKKNLNKYNFFFLQNFVIYFPLLSLKISNRGGIRILKACKAYEGRQSLWSPINECFYIKNI